MKKFIKSLIIVCFTVFITSCAGPFTIEDSGSTVNLTNDDPFEIELEGNASTGYTWQVMPFDSTVIKQVGEPEFNSKDGKIGSGGMITFKFQTIGDGQTDLLLVYRRLWEENEPPAKKFELKIVVGTMGRILED
ncbi:MAG TPA: protease inhibitor I42 family protein [Bacteroidales bacterium]|jgi:inhibitor of cysteine peptidase|nr:hypothetical protein [Bacteroidota bacterium]HJN06815.1 protease inhibitor I42 family protein [Bacteroidales bacterium]